MMEKKYIDANKLNRKKKYCFQTEYGTFPKHEYFIKAQDFYEMPAADVEEVKHGKWILEREPNGKPYCFHCSVCDDDFHYISIVTKYPYCPNCGAKMDREENNE